jgi:hypothetical protein
MFFRLVRGMLILDCPNCLCQKPKETPSAKDAVNG